MRTPVQEAFLSIIRYEIAGTPLPDGFSVPDMEALLELTEMQDLTHLVYDALKKNGLPCNSSKAISQYYASMWRVEQMEYELCRMSDVFEDNGIDFIPLKGSVIRSLYPEPWMRPSADIDLLLKADQEKTAEKLLAGELGYEFEKGVSYAHHGTMFSPNNHIHIEPHWTLFHETQSDNSYVKLFARVWDRALPDPSGRGHRYMLSDADTYAYHVAHMEKHFHESGGCSIRGLIDLWLMNRVPDPDLESRRRLLAEGGLTRFENRMNDLIECWMQGLPVENEYLEQFILSGYLYGTLGRKACLQTEQKGSAKYIFERIFMPYAQIKTLYPVLEKHPWLLPAMWVRRWIKVADKDSRIHFAGQVKASVSTDKRTLNDLRDLAVYLGIE